MPPIREISFADGVKIVGDGIPSVDIAIAQFPQTGTLANREAALNKLIQEQYEVKTLLSDLLADNPDERVFQDPPVLLPCERIEKIVGKNYLITTTMFIQVHIYSLSPLKYTIRCSDEPITEEWW